jgi:CTP:molybdopterin cytidylyltransferase MocA
MNTILMSLLNYNAIPISISIIHGDMPRVTPETTRKIFEDIENTRTNGMLFASKYLLEHQY